MPPFFFVGSHSRISCWHGGPDFNGSRRQTARPLAQMRRSFLLELPFKASPSVPDPVRVTASAEATKAAESSGGQDFGQQPLVHSKDSPQLRLSL